MSVDDEIYQGIGEILVAISPADAEVVLVEAEFSPEGDHCKLLFDYLVPSGTKQWFLPSSAKVDSDLLHLFVRLRNFFESNGRRRQKLSATPDLSGTVLPLCHIPNSALKNAPPSKSATPRASACAGLLA
ncbi:hypothetical protein M6G63_06200 [Pseudomonas sp. BYT-5]|uniref:hypothetical protein n=1 Tax=unclassified Pseudomonas TaxID=196821 RepID=UPI002021DC3F|nr:MULTISPECIES: hypothetical protein [unclassified Pseudomonas]URD43843.1 hypothetical protein M6G63_06200 [Pseudomonas sp. BYT-5]URK99186.1 hypothetical protein J5X93_06185 [Pseudomonas sp. BYT-1]